MKKPKQQQQDDPDYGLRAAIASLSTDARFRVYVDMLRERREGWIGDLSQPLVYHSHPEVSAVTGRISELNWLLGLVEDVLPAHSDAEDDSGA